MNTLVVRQKVKSQNEGNKKAKHAKFSESKHFLSPDTQGRKNYLLSGKFSVLCFLVISILRFHPNFTKCEIDANAYQLFRDLLDLLK